MSTYNWSVPTGNIITGSTYIKDTDNKIQDTMNDLSDFVNSSGSYTGQGLMFDYVDKANNQTITGVKTFSNGLIGNVTGNSGTATKLATARTIALTGDVTGSVSFDGSANASITTTVGDDSHSHSIAYIAGLQTALNGKLSTSGNAASATYAATAGSATSATNSNTVGGLTATQIGNTYDNAHSFVTNGYQKLGNGLIFQWATVTESASSTDYRTFPIAFPTACIMVNVQLNSSTSGGLGQNVGTIVEITDRTKFIWTAAGTFGGGGVAYMFAIGY